MSVAAPEEEAVPVTLLELVAVVVACVVEPIALPSSVAIVVLSVPPSPNPKRASTRLYIFVLICAVLRISSASKKAKIFINMESSKSAM